MRILTWNINSVRLRLPHLKKIAKEINPDIICLQETKVVDHLFPQEDIKKLGYPFIHIQGMKSYNGVAILSKIPFTPTLNMPIWCNKNDCRYVGIKINGHKTLTIHNFYVPAGGDVPDPKENPKFKHKLDLLKEVTHFFTKNTPNHTVIVGDFNIAPLADDVWSDKQLRHTVSHTQPEIDHLNAWEKTGFNDLARHLAPNGKLYSWWSYRNRDWKKSNRGRRLDHIWASSDLVPHLQDVNFYPSIRDWQKPSDHIPITADFTF